MLYKHEKVNFMDKKKILLVITNGSNGGAQRYVFDLAINLADNFDVFVAIGEPKGMKDLQKKLAAGNEQLTNKIRVIQLRHLVRPISPMHDILSVFELANLYKKIIPDIVHLNSSKAGTVGSVAKLLINFPPQRKRSYSLSIVYTVHGWIFQTPMPRIKRLLYILLEKWTAKLKNQIIVLSKTEAIIAKQILQIPNDKIKIIPLGISFNHPLDKATAKKEILKRKNIPTEDKWVVTIANFFRTKGLDILIDAVTLNKTAFMNTQFIIIGDGQNRKMLEEKISAQNLQHNIHLLGYIDGAARLLPAFDLMVIPSRKEGLPYAALEGIAAGLPIIATKTGGLPELLQHEDLLVTPGDARELSKKIMNALLHPLKTEVNISSVAEMLSSTMAVYRSYQPKQN